MGLVLYSQFIQFPDGTPAADFPVPVLRRGSNQLSLLFQDELGTLPAANPFVTDGDGFMSWWAAPDEYETWMSGFPLRIPIDPSHTAAVLPGLWVHQQSTPATVWTVDHHFGVEPAVSVLVAGQHTEADVTHPDAQTTVITFAVPTVGMAQLRR
jgi:hypothetical protein